MINRYWEDKFFNIHSENEFARKVHRNQKNIAAIQKKYSFNTEVVNKLSFLTKESMPSLYVVLITGVSILIDKYFNYSREEIDFVFGCHSIVKGVEDAARILPFIDKLDANKSCNEMLVQIKESFIEFENNKNISMNDIISIFMNNKPNDRGLINVSIVLENLLGKYDTYLYNEQLIFKFVSTNSKLEMKIVSSRQDFAETTIKRMGEHLEKIIEEIVENPTKKIKDISLITEGDIKKIEGFNATESELLERNTVIEILAETMQKEKEKTAVIYKGERMCYGELEERTDNLAKYLQKQGVTRNTVVGIQVNRSFEMLIGIFSIIKAGGAYMPILPSYPEERKGYMLEDSGVKILLTTREVMGIDEKKEIPDIYKSIEVMYLEEEYYNKVEQQEELVNITEPEDMLYVIYTSGSTGKPKGVMISHKALINRIKWMQKQYPLTEKDIILQKTSYCFDVSVWELLWGGFVGASVVMLEQGDEMSPEKIIKEIYDNGVTVMHFVPSMFNTYIQWVEGKSNEIKKMESLRYIFSSGETLLPQSVNRFNENVAKDLKCLLVNLYGPTEAAIDVTYYDCKKEKIYENIPIGKPIDNIKIYIVDEDMHMQPIGVAGELCISGVGVAKGYINKKELTNEKFVESEYCQGKLYKTGDLARWEDDGNITYISRIDNQVKIRGFRIELGEIESCMVEHEQIIAAAILIKEIKEENYIVAYYVSEDEISRSQINRFMSERLPGYMIPSYFVKVDEIPVTSNGKLDRRKLLEIELENIKLEEYIAPSNEREEKLVKIFEDILKREKVGAIDSFFDLGGHSLKATVLMSKIYEKFGVTIPIKDIFKYPTVKELSQVIQETSPSSNVLFKRIEAVEENERYETSAMQKRLYTIQQLDLKSIAYNMPICLKIEGKVDKSQIEDTFIALIQRHEGLRTVFELEDGEIYQKISEEFEFSLEELSIEGNNWKEEYKKFIRAFDLKNGPLIHAGVGRITDDEHILCIDMHHIVSDGISVNILVKEFAKIYNNEELEEIKVTYKDFAKWSNEISKSEEMDKEKAYWVNKFDDEIPVLNLPVDFNRTSEQEYEGKTLTYEIKEGLAQRVLEICNATKTTEYMVLLSMFNILLSKYSRQTDIVVGSPVAGRRNVELQNVVGMFVNTLAVRTQIDLEDEYEVYLNKLKENVIRDFDNQDYQFDELVENLNIKRELSRNPLFDVLFSVETVDRTQMKLPEMNIMPIIMKEGIAKFDLSVVAYTDYDGMYFDIEYAANIFAETTIKRMGEHLEKIIEEIVENPTKKIKDISLITEGDIKKIEGFNATESELLERNTVIEILAETMQKEKEKTAVIYKGERMCYGELEERTDNLAKYLQKQGVTRNTVVGIQVNRSFEMLIGIFSIIKAGGAYMPILPSYPEERKGYMLEDSGVKILLTTREVMGIDEKKEIPDIYKSIEVMYLEEEYYNKVEQQEELVNITEPEDMLYVIYTSGSTGKPKGVMISHKALINRIKWMQKQYPLTEKDIILQKTSYCFDVSVWELLWGGFVGASVVMLEQGDEMSPEKIIKEIYDNGVTVMHFVPSMFNTYIQWVEGKSNEIKKMESLRYIFSSGETLLPQSVNRFNENVAKDLKCLLVNLYGPTEAAIDVTYYDCKKEKIYENIPIGKPIDNIKIYIVDEDMHMQPIGVAGELCISGVGVAKGYINKKELTNEKFVESEYCQGKLYKTGDLARWEDDGNITYISRIDNQVKIRGFRIELGEIESCMVEHEQIIAAAILIKEIKEENYIVAYYVSEDEISRSQINRFMSERLPGYMIPSYFVKVDEIPVTSNGKLDRRKLLEIELENIKLEEYIAPSNEREEKLVKIFEDILKREKVGAIDSFFDLGGHSLKATVLMSKIYEKFGVTIPIKDIFKYPTVKELSQVIQETSPSSNVLFKRIEAVEENERYETSAMQKRLYTIQQLDLKSIAYNMPICLKIEGKVDKSQIEDTFIALIQRHEGLRTVFELEDGEIYQKISEEFEFSLEELSIEGNNWKEEYKKFIRAFDLKNGPLIHAGVGRITDDEHILCIDMHHIVSDGISVNILVKEFAKIYNNEELEEIKVTYKDFAKWSNEISKSEEMDKEKAYWVNKFDDEIPVLNLPVDFNRTSEQEYEGKTLTYEIKEGLAQRVLEICNATKTTEYMVLLSMFNILLSKYSRQTDIVVGSPVAGRRNVELQNVVGMFVNTLAVRTQIDLEDEYEVYLNKLKENVIRDFDNQDYQFDELVENLNIKRELSRNPLFDVLFSVETVDRTQMKLPEMNIMPIIMKEGIAKFDLSVVAYTDYDGMYFDIEYAANIFAETTIKRMGEHLEKIIEEIVENPTKKIKDISLITEGDIKKIEGFNATESELLERNTVIEILAETMQKEKEKTAVIYKGERMCYGELEERTDNLAKYLQKQGVTRNTVVGIQVNRSFEMLIGIFSIIKAGGAYMPILPSYPEERKGYMLEDSGVKILLTTREVMGIDEKKEIPDIYKSIEVMYLEEEYYNKVEQQEELVNITEPEDMLYVIYTSGSTGKPKGVMISHKALINRIKWMQKQYPLTEKDIILQKTSYCFDVSVWELLWGGFVGASVVMLEQGDEMSPEKIIKEIYDNGVTVMHFVPSMFNTYIQWVEGKSNEIKKMESLRYIFSSGETLLPQSVNRFNENVAKDLKCLLVNLYGPTEAAIDVTYYDCKKEKIYENIPIGKPIDNIKIYIVDEDMHMQPIGVAGELCISGVGVAKGYINKKELTNEKFVESEYCQGKLYKTGDLARWEDDGNITYISRIDNQVKIRGFRIELGEIESCMVEHEQIIAAAILIKEIKEENYIVAYYVSEDEISRSQINRFMSERLPGYMIPSYFVKVDEIPVTSNGKLDRRKLLEIELENIKLEEYIAPSNEREEKLVKIFEDILKREKVGAIDSFFDLGGHSLKATVLMSKIYEKFGVTIPIKDIFKYPTVKELSQVIQETSPSSNVLFKRIEAVEENERYETSAMQKRLYTIQQLDLKSIAYNMPICLKIEGKVDKSQIEDTFIALIQRHEGLRTVFELEDGEIYQKISEEFEFSLEELSIEGNNWKEEYKKFIRAFDLKNGPLIHAGVGRITDDEHILCIDMHHIVSDGISVNILVKEFAKIYNNEELEEIKVTYKDFAKWSNEISKSEEMDKEKAYWVNKFDDEIPVLNLPVDFNRTSEQEYEGKIEEFVIASDIVKELKSVCEKTNTTEYMVLFLILKILLSKYSGQTDIVVGSPVAGRRNIELQNVVGMFVNTLPIYTKLNINKSFEWNLASLKKNIIDDLDNQDCQFNDIIDELGVKTTKGQSPLFNVLFAMQNTNQEIIQLPNMKISGLKIYDSNPKFDLTFTIYEKDQERVMEIEYVCRLFSSKTINNLFRHFIEILKAVIKNNNIILKDIQMLTRSEYNRQIYEINDTKIRDDKHLQILEQIYTMAKSQPRSIALISENKEICFKELNEYSNIVGNMLIEQGVKENDCIGILMDRSVEFVYTVLGVIKAGASYIPIDRNYPNSRINYILSDANPKLLLVNFNDVDLYNVNCKVINVLGKTMGNYSMINIEKEYSENRSIYLLYTSGSTGHPKGVDVKLSSFENLLNWYIYEFNIDKEDNNILLAATSFDLAQKNIFATLMRGGKLTIPKAGYLDIKYLSEIINKNNVTILNCTPSMFYPFVELNSFNNFNEINSLRKIFLGGESIQTDKLKPLYQSDNFNGEIINTYGPTECTDIAASYKITKYDIVNNNAIPIGKPIDNVNLYVLDKSYRLLPEGFVGELFIGGIGLSNGYHGKREMTNEVFRECDILDGEMLYRTGDMVRIIKDNNILYIGRKDSQVKVRGFRIELSEIENVMNTHKLVKTSAVICKEIAGEKNICMFVQGDNLSIKDINEYLKSKLPKYMIPNFIVNIDKMPYSSNGKLDRKKLQDYKINRNINKELKEPRTETEKRVSKIWKDVLGIQEVSRMDNFFDIGGNSISMLRVHNELIKIKEVELEKLFKYDVLEDLSKYLDEIV